MHRLSLSGPDRPLRKALFLGAHCDDIEIGCGGSVLRLARECPDLSVQWIVFSSGGARTQEAREAAARFLEGFPNTHVEVLGFRNGFFPWEGAAVKEYFESLKARVDPDVIFTHHGDDRHQDHRVLCELTWNTFRNHLVLEYEIPKYDGDLSRPNLYVPLDSEICDRKIGHVLSCFESQREKHWFDDVTFRGIMRLRGMECAAPGGYAEAFHARKVVL